MLRTLSVAVVVVSSVECLVPKVGVRHGASVRHQATRMGSPFDDEAGVFDPLNVASTPWTNSAERRGANSGKSASAMAALGAAAFLAAPDQAVAKGGEYGILEGRIVSLAHPTIMGGCFLVSLAAGYTGLQWRRTREIGVEVGELKKQLKGPKAEMEKLQAEVAALPEGTEPNPAHASTLVRLKGEVAAMQAVIDEKSAVRKDLASQNFRDPHWALGSVLLGAGVTFAIEGPVNTYLRAGKLFPGPHLYAGAGCTVLWALAASLVPEMQKGKEWARTGHISANVLSTALFAYYQIPTGIGIAQKVIQFTKFP